MVAAAAVLLLLLSSMTTKMREPSEDFKLTPSSFSAAASL